ncbi:MAG: uridine kinase [Clostridiales bacterium]|nr:uridine kinase [Clostridiales bacterium]
MIAEVHDMLFIGICGASGSGKSTLAESLQARLGERCLVMQQDAYYIDHSHLPFEERVLLNYDEPSIFDHDLLLQDIRMLMAGEPITRKAYDYANHRRADTGEIIQPREVMILEGIHTFHDPRLCDLMYLKLYMNVETDICLLRRIHRDIKERGRDIDGISAQYLNTVKPMYDKYIKNYINEADVIVARGGKNARIVDILTGYVEDQLARNTTL